MGSRSFISLLGISSTDLIVVLVYAPAACEKRKYLNYLRSPGEYQEITPKSREIVQNISRVEHNYPLEREAKASPTQQKILLKILPAYHNTI